MLMRSISGLRGIVGEGLTPEALTSHISAFLQVTKAKSIVVGRDARVSGPSIERLVCSICEMAGVDVYPLGLATTPTVELAVVDRNASGGIIITASHNPQEWNALKFLNDKGMFLGPTEVKELLSIADSEDRTWKRYDKLGVVHENFNADKAHIDNILGLGLIDAKKIRSKKFKVACDLVNGAASTLMPQLLEELGCEVTVIHDTPNGIFPRGGEPTPENLGDLEKAVKDNGCIVGVAVDPDSDRCALVDENGQAMGEEYTLALALDICLANQKSDVAVNLSTSLLNDTVAQKYGCKVVRTAVGEINVSLKMVADSLKFGGEGNGGVILADSHYGRDAMVSAALALQWLADNDSTPSEFKASLPPYTMVKDKLPVDGLDPEEFIGKVKAKYADCEQNEVDGLRIQLDNSWIHLRKSNTEPIFRIITESAIEGDAQKLANDVRDLL